MKMRIYSPQDGKHFDAECEIIAATKGSFYLVESLPQPIFPPYIAIGFVNNKKYEESEHVIVPINTDEDMGFTRCLPVYTCVNPYTFNETINSCFKSEDYYDLKHTAEEVLTLFKMHGTPIHPDCLDIDKFFENYNIKNIQQHD